MQALRTVFGRKPPPNRDGRCRISGRSSPGKGRVSRIITGTSIETGIRTDMDRRGAAAAVEAYRAEVAENANLRRAVTAGGFLNGALA